MLKVTPKKEIVEGKAVYKITIEGHGSDFELIVDALQSHRDERVQNIGSYIRKAVSQ